MCHNWNGWANLLLSLFTYLISPSISTLAASNARSPRWQSQGPSLTASWGESRKLLRCSAPTCCCCYEPLEHIPTGFAFVLVFVFVFVFVCLCNSNYLFIPVFGFLLCLFCHCIFVFPSLFVFVFVIVVVFVFVFVYFPKKHIPPGSAFAFLQCVSCVELLSHRPYWRGV